MDCAVRVEGLGRQFGSRGKRTTALDGVSFSIAEGAVVAVLGTNGAGKTTLTKILSTLLLPSTGRAWILGHDVVADVGAARALTSAIFGGDRGLYTRLSGRENLRFFAMLAGVGRRELLTRGPEVLDQVGLAAVADRRVETYSKGMRQRLHIAIGVISRPRVLLLDEPTVGLDPLEAARLRASIREMATSGTTVLLTSHYLLDVEELAERVIMLSKGRVVTDRPLADFAAQAGYAAVVELRGIGSAAGLATALPPSVTLDGTTEVAGGWTASLRLRSWGADVFRELGDLLQSVTVVDIQVRPARLDEAYARLSAEEPA